MPLANASVSTTKGKEKLGRAKTGADIRAFLRVWNTVSVLDVHTNKVPFLSRLVRGLEMRPNCETNRLYYLVIPRKLLSSLTLEGVG